MGILAIKNFVLMLSSFQTKRPTGDFRSTVASGGENLFLRRTDERSATLRCRDTPKAVVTLFRDDHLGRDGSDDDPCAGHGGAESDDGDGDGLHCE